MSDFPQNPYRPQPVSLSPGDDFTTYPTEPDPVPRQPLTAGGIIAWMVVSLVTVALIALILVQQLNSANQVGGDATSGDMMAVGISARMVVAQNNIGEVLPGNHATNTALPAELDGGCYEQRLAFAILKNEVKDPTAALDYLTELDSKVEEHDLILTENQQQLRELLEDLFVQYESGILDSNTLAPGEQTLIKDQLGYCGELVLLPKGTPHASQRKEFVTDAVYKLIGVALVILLGGLFGLFGLVMAAVFGFQTLRGGLWIRFQPSETNHNVYIETFAIWIVIFFGSSLVMGMLITNASLQMLSQPVIFFGSLGCLLWPIARGVAWRQVMADIGWRSAEPLNDVCVTPFSYAATLPMLIPGILCVAVAGLVISLMQDSHEFSRQATPGHPIQEYISSGDVLMISMVFLTACVAAPIVEETMFRGVLYRHLRDWSAGYSTAVSVAFAAVVNGFIFAAIHPQGLIAVPVLMSLAICFSLTREWRGSLIAPMAMHALHNTAITCVSLMLL